MHELSIIQGALEQAIEAAKKSGATRILRLRIRVGALSGVVPEALQFGFEAARLGTMAEQATLELETVPAACWCRRCQAEFTGEAFAQECPRCGEFSPEMRRGMELELAQVEVS